MSESKAPARPSQVTMAGWVAVVGSALLVLTLFDSMAQLRSVEVRRSIEEFLATAPGSGLGLDTDQVRAILRGTMLFAGAAAAAATVLAVYVLQRNKGARVGFSVAAVAIMLTAPVTGSPFAVLVAIAAVMLWTRPARDWFAGRAPAPTEQRGVLVSSEHPRPDEHRTDPGGSAGWPRMPDESSDRPEPPPTQGFGEPVPGRPPYGQQAQGQQAQGQQAQQQGWQEGQQPPYGQPSYGQPSYGQPSYGQAAPYAQQPYAQQPYPGHAGYGQPRDPDKRPTTVTVAAWLTWIFSGLTLLAFALVVLVMLAARGDFIDAMRSEPEFQRLDVSSNDVVAALWVVSAIIVFWCLVAFVLGVLTYRRQNWARITLVISAGFTALFSLAAITSVVSLLTLVAAGATIVLLFTGGANEWFSRNSGRPSYSQPYGGSGQEPGGQQYGGQQYGDQRYGQPSYGAPGDRPGPGQPESGDRQEPPKNVW